MRKQPRHGARKRRANACLRLLRGSAPMGIRQARGAGHGPSKQRCVDARGLKAIERPMAGVPHELDFQHRVVGVDQRWRPWSGVVSGGAGRKHNPLAGPSAESRADRREAGTFLATSPPCWVSNAYNRYLTPRGLLSAPSFVRFCGFWPSNLGDLIGGISDAHGGRKARRRRQCRCQENCPLSQPTALVTI